MTGCPDDEQLAQLAEGRLATADAARLESHFSSCSACTAAIRELGALAAEPFTAPPRYRIVRELGAGGMGVVYLAEDTELGRQVALKLWRAERVHDAEAATERLRAEARVLARLAHPNVLAIHDVGTLGGRAFVALEYVAGETALVAQTRRTWPAVIDLYRQAARGLAAAHALGIVHRDVKPDNLLVGDDGRVRVGDFGLAVALAAVTRGSGTPAYMAPEQQAGQPATPASDQFSLCVSLAEGLIGARPPAGSSPAALRELARPTRGDAIPGAVWIAIARGLSRDPAARFSSCDALADALGSRPARRRGWILAGALVAGAATAAVWLLAQRDDTASAVAVQLPVAVVPPAAHAIAPPPAPAPPPAKVGQPVHAPVAVRHAPPAMPSDFRGLLRFAQDHDSDSRLCLAAIDRAAALQPDAIELPFARSSCELAAHDCTHGLADLRVALERTGWRAELIDAEVKRTAAVRCPVPDGTAEQRIDRLAAAIGSAADRGDFKACSAIQGDLDHAWRTLGGHGSRGKLVAQTRYDIMRCYVASGRCDWASNTWQAYLGSRDGFAHEFPSCQ